MWLRRNREARRLTIEDLARTTKISKTILRAIESGDVLRLPAGIYTRGFVKAYAREVGLDPDRTADEYLTRLEPLTVQGQVDHGQLTPMADAAMEAHDDARPMLPADQLRRFSWVTTGLAIAGLIIYLVSFADRDVGQNTPAVTAADAASAAAHGVPATPQMEREAVARTSGAALAPGGGPLRVEIRTQGLCWLVITVDGVPMLARLLQAGERHTFDVEQQAEMRVGDPGALTFSINGQTTRTLGPAGQPVDVRITKDNFRQFLGS